MFQKKGVFLIIVYGLWSEKFALSEKNNCLGFNNSVLCIQRNVPGENFCIKKLFFSKNSRILREKFSNFCEVVSGMVDIIPSYFCRGRFQGKIFSKKVFFFIVSRLGAKNRLLKEQQDICENFILRVWWNFLRKNTLFKVIWYIFSCISSEEL